MEGSLRFVRGSASCCDPRLPAPVALEGSFCCARWHSTGLWPQRLALTLASHAKVSRVVLSARGVRRVRVVGTAAHGKIVELGRAELDDCGGLCTTSAISLEEGGGTQSVDKLIFTIWGQGDFCFVEKVRVPALHECQTCLLT